jgi:hypothetical protein
MKAWVAHFYGWTDDYINKMPYEKFLSYLKCITMIMASKDMRSLNIISFPNLKENSKRKDLIRGLERESKKFLFIKRKIKSYHEVLKNLASKFNG